MHWLLIGALCLLTLSLPVSGQVNRTVRPRVVPAETPVIAQPPSLKNDIPATPGDRRPPVLTGGAQAGTIPNSTNPSAASTSKTSDDEVIRVETNLVTMPVSVIDREGRFVSGLQAKDFRIYENGAEQKVEYFQSVEQPFTVVLMLDISPSTQYRIDEIQDAAIAFVDQLRPNDKVMVIAFDEDVHVFTRPTNDRHRLRFAIRQAQFGNGTSLYEAVDRVINRELRSIEGRKAVVLFTDGVDTTSRRASYDSTITDVEEVDALFYPVRYNTQRDGFGGRGVVLGPRGNDPLEGIIGIILGGSGFPSRGRVGSQGSSSAEYETGRRYLETLAQNSGGRKFEADTFNNLEAAFAGIAEELRRQYSLGYYPEHVGQVGDRKQIKVRVMRPNLIVKAKTTYIVGQNSAPHAGR